MTDIALRESGPSEVEEVSGLLERCFEANPKADPEVMTWQYWSNPFGTTRSWVAVNDGRIVGHHAAYVVPMRRGSVHFSAAIQIDTATESEFRGRGLYGDLSRKLYASCRSDGVATMLGNPNEQALGPLRRVGWIEVADLRLYIRVLDPGWMSERTRLPGWVTRGSRRLLFRTTGPSDATVGDVVPEGLDRLVADCADDETASVDIGSDWWQWRFADHPKRPYFFIEVRRGGRLEAAAACRTRDEQGGRFVDLLDFVARSPAPAREVVDAVPAAVPDAVGILMTASPGGPYGKTAGWAGLRRIPRRLRPTRTYFGVFPLIDDQDLSHVAWDVSLGSLDYA
jgi:hypothetical protein